MLKIAFIDLGALILFSVLTRFAFTRYELYEHTNRKKRELWDVLSAVFFICTVITFIAAFPLFGAASDQSSEEPDTAAPLVQSVEQVIEAERQILTEHGAYTSDLLQLQLANPQLSESESELEIETSSQYGQQAAQITASDPSGSFTALISDQKSPILSCQHESELCQEQEWTLSER